MMRKKIYFISLFIFFVSFSSFSQRKEVLDSMNKLITKAKVDSTRAFLFIEKGKLFLGVNNNDSAFFWMKKAIGVNDSSSPVKKQKARALNNIAILFMKRAEMDSAVTFILKAIELKKELKDYKGVLGSTNNLVAIYRGKGEIRKVIELEESLLEMINSSEDKKLQMSVLGNVGQTYEELGDYKKSLEYFLKKLKIAETINDTVEIAQTNCNIANDYLTMGDYTGADLFFKKAIPLAEVSGNKGACFMVYNNVGNFYKLTKNYTKAEEYYLKAKSITTNDDPVNISYVYCNLGMVYSQLGKKELAEECMKKAIEIRSAAKDKRLYAIALIMYGEVLVNNGKFKPAIEIALKGYDIAHEIGALEKEKDGAAILSGAYDASGDYKNALKFTRIYMQLKDTLYNSQKIKDINKKVIQFEFDKKETLLNAEQEKKEVQHNEEAKRQRLTLYMVITVLLLVLIFSGFIYNRFKITKQQKQIIEIQQLETSSQKEIIEQKNKEITDSLHYAKRIQHALLASEQLLNETLKEYFILYKPKDIVSGDFYWARQKGDWLYMVTGDCTGHGVPGAFMSLLNISFLNEAITNTNFIHPNEILGFVRTHIIDALKSDGSQEGGKDGMDAVLCAFNFKTRTLMAACANNPVWIIRNKEVIKIEQDKFPVGKHDKQNEAFTLHEVKLEKDDLVCTLTDGYGDQFGGPKGKKFKYKYLQELLVKNADKKLSEQKEILHSTIENWRGNLEQVDDILIIGVRI